MFFQTLVDFWLPVGHKRRHSEEIGHGHGIRAKMPPKFKITNASMNVKNASTMLLKVNWKSSIAVILNQGASG